MSKCINLTTAEKKLAELIWREAPLTSLITSFFGGRKLSTEQATELKRLIEEHESGDEHG